MDAVISDHDPSGGLARDHDARGSGQRGALAFAKDVGLRGVEAGVPSQRLVHQRDERPAGSERAGLWQCPERKPIEDNRTAARSHGQYLQRRRALRGGRKRKAVSQVQDIDLPTQPPQLLDHAPVIAITSGRRGEITRYGERNTPYLARSLHTLHKRWSRNSDGFRASGKPNTGRLCHGCGTGKVCKRFPSGPTFRMKILRVESAE